MYRSRDATAGDASYDRGRTHVAASSPILQSGAGLPPSHPGYRRRIAPRPSVTSHLIYLFTVTISSFTSLLPILSPRSLSPRLPSFHLQTPYLLLRMVCLNPNCQDVGQHTSHPLTSAQLCIPLEPYDTREPTLPSTRWTITLLPDPVGSGSAASSAPRGALLLCQASSSPAQPGPTNAAGSFSPISTE